MITLSLSWEHLDALGSLMGGIFTAATFAATLALLIREMRIRRLDDQRALSVHDDEERRRARLVYAALDPAAEDGGSHVPRSLDDAWTNEDRSVVAVVVYNHGDEPVWDIEVPIPGREGRPFLIEHIPPHESARRSWHDAPSDWYLMNIGPGCPGLKDWLSLSVRFVDGQGRRWQRAGREEPVRILDSVPHDAISAQEAW